MKTRLLAPLAVAALMMTAAPHSAHAQFEGLFSGMFNNDARITAQSATGNPQDISPASGASFESRDILEVQRALTAKGYYSGPLDGIPGPRTEKAVTHYQSTKNLEATGTLDAATLDSLGLGARLNLSAGASVNQ